VGIHFSKQARQNGRGYGNIEAPSTTSEAVADGEQKAANKGERVERVKRLERPNRAALEEEVAKLNQTVEQHQARLQEIKGLIDNKIAGRQGVSGEVAEARNKLNELVNHYKALIEEKNSIKEELRYIDQAREKAREEAKSMKSKLPYVRSVARL
jgi:chromosome segregation ATPase